MAAWQVFAIELKFDPALDAQIETARNQLARLTNSPESTFKPRKTLLTSRFIRDIPTLANALRRFAAQHPPLPVYFDFIPAGSATISASPSQSVLAFHNQLHIAFVQEGLTEFSEAAFTIYDSIAEGVSDMDRAFDDLRDLDLVRVTGFGTEILVVRYMPHSLPQICFSCALGGARRERGRER